MLEYVIELNDAIGPYSRSKSGQRPSLADYSALDAALGTAIAKIQVEGKSTVQFSDMSIDMRVQAVRKIASADKAFADTATADASALASASSAPGKGGSGSDKLPTLLRAAYRTEMIEACDEDPRVTNPIKYLDAENCEVDIAESGLDALLRVPTYSPEDALRIAIQKQIQLVAQFLFSQVTVTLNRPLLNRLTPLKRHLERYIVNTAAVYFGMTEISTIPFPPKFIADLIGGRWHKIDWTSQVFNFFHERESSAWKTAPPLSMPNSPWRTRRSLCRKSNDFSASLDTR